MGRLVCRACTTLSYSTPDVHSALMFTTHERPAVRVVFTRGGKVVVGITQPKNPEKVLLNILLSSHLTRSYDGPLTPYAALEKRMNL